MRKLVGILVVAFLFSMPSYSGAEDFRSLHPDLAARIKALRDQVQARHGSYEVGYSAAMDKTIAQLCGLKVPPGWDKSDAPSMPMLSATLQALPSSYDWRSLNGLTPVKNQGSCGDCWAFGTVGPLESQILIKDGVSVDLSEQYLNSCNRSGWSCNGGWWAHDYHLNRVGEDQSEAGGVLEANAPYTATDAACSGPYSHPYKLSNWAYVGSESAVPTVQAIKQAIYTYGPIAAAVYVGPTFQAYDSGIFNTSEKAPKGSSPVNHAIMLVGWNDDLGPDNGYWILRNSWGPSWGELGYMRIRYGVSKVGYAANFVEYAGGTVEPPPAPVGQKPDLSGSFTKLATRSSGKVLTGTIQVKNIGTAATASQFRVLLYLSNNGTTKDSLIGQATVTPAIQPGSYVNLSIKKRNSKSVRRKYVIGVIDPDNTVSESNEGNDVVVKRIP